MVIIFTFLLKLKISLRVSKKVTFSNVVWIHLYEFATAFNCAMIYMLLN